MNIGKINDMNCSKLMLYDYVSFTDSHKIRKIAKISWLGESGSVLIYNKNLHDTTYSDEIFVNSKHIHPVELTRDILTNNGFKTQYIELVQMFSSCLTSRLYVGGRCNDI